MSRPLRIGLKVLGSLVALLAIVTALVLIVARSNWLREKLRTTIVEQAEKATGGRVEIGSFALDWSGLTADVDRFVLHGTEAAGQAPLLAVDHVRVGFKIISLFTRDIRLDHVEVTHPQVHLIVDGAGGTNLPKPKVAGNTRTADAILNLKIGKFDVKNGEAMVESPGAPPRTYPWSGTGKNLAANATYDALRDRYAGDASMAPLHLTLEGYGPLDLGVSASAAMERNRIVVSKAALKSEGSEIDLAEMTIGSFADPVVTAKYKVQVAASEAVKVLHWKLPVSGILTTAGNARYVSPTNFEVSGDLQGTGMAYGNIRNIRLSGKLAGNQSAASLTNLHASVMGGTVTGAIETKSYETYSIKGNVSGLSVRDLAVLGTPKPLPYDGLVSGPVTASGRFRDLSRFDDATARLTIVPAKTGAPVNGALEAHYTGAGSKLELGQSFVELPGTRVDVSGELGKAGASLSVKLESKDLNDLLPVLNGRALPFTLQNGLATFAGTVTGTVDDPHIAGHAEVRNAVYEGRTIDSAVGDVAVSMKQASAQKLQVSYAGMMANGSGTIVLENWAAVNTSAITGNVSVSDVDITHALDVARQKDLQVTGAVSVMAQVTGTLGAPAADADIVLRKGLIYQQPYDSVTTHVRYVNADLQTASGTFLSGVKHVDFDVTYPHAGQAFPAGLLNVSVTSNSMPLNQIALIRQRQPDIQGAAQFKGSGQLKITRDAKNAVHVELAKLDGDGAVTGIGLAGRELGDSHFSARTAGTTLSATFDSNAAGASIQGEAKVELAGEDKVTGSVTFSNTNLNSLATLIVKPADANEFNFDGTAEGRVDFSGPLFTPAQMSATVAIPKIEVHPAPGSSLAKTLPGFSLQNSGPLRVSFARSVIRIESARFEAPETDVTVSGTADISANSPLNLRLQGNVNLAMLRNFVPDLASSGSLALSGNMQGSFSSPNFTGHGSIRNGEFHYGDFTNSLNNAVGEIVFSGSRAIIQSFTADTGGGKFTGAGFVTLSNGDATFQFSAKTHDVRVRYPQGVSSVSDADIQILHNPQRSSISGAVTVKRLTFNPQDDAAVMLAEVSKTARAPAVGDSSFSNMNLDVQIQTAPDVALQSKVAEEIQADASLRLRGTVSSPALLGRVNVSQGSVLFFGNKYTISRGSISFFNPARIDPILDVDLETKARGVDVTLTVTGPIAKPGMTYRSDPPLEFSDIVALLATGRTPDDPSVAMRGTAPTPSFEQLGASALIGQTIANPVAGRLQRFFGVSRIKIDPQLSGVSGNPGARLTVEQQVTPDILFTYITDVSNTSQQLIRVEWAFNRNWSAVLEREENGYVGLDFTYKKRFK